MLLSKIEDLSICEALSSSLTSSSWPLWLSCLVIWGGKGVFLLCVLKFFMEWPTRAICVIFDHTVLYELRFSLPELSKPLPILWTFDCPSLQVFSSLRSIWSRFVMLECDLGVSWTGILKHIVTLIDSRLRVPGTGIFSINSPSWENKLGDCDLGLLDSVSIYLPGRVLPVGLGCIC